MNILITVYDAWEDNGGTAISTGLIAKNLTELGHKVFIASTGRYPQVPTHIFYKIRRFPFFILRDFLLKSFFLKIIKQRNIDLIYASDCRFTAVAAVLAGKKSHIKTVVHYRDYWFRCLRGDMLHDQATCDGQNLDFCYSIQSKNLIFWEFYKLKYFKKRLEILKLADLNLSVSLAMNKRLILAGLTNRTEVVYDLFDLKPINTTKVVKLGSDKLKVIFVGRLVDHRGVKTLMSIAKILQEQKRSIELTLVGDGELMEYCQKFISHNQLLNINMLGVLSYDNTLAIYHQADVFLFPSRLEEPFGRVVIEAMASGLPVIVSKVGALTELVTNGVDGFLVDINDITGFIERLLLLQDKKLLNQMSVAALVKAEHFDQKSVSENLNNYLTSLK